MAWTAEPTPARGTGTDTSADTSVDGLEVDDRFPGLGRFGRLLEVGAGHLAAARAAHREQCRLAGAQVRGLAAFAAARPAALLDRPDDEVGAAAAASRAARPAALTEVSEWAVDEVMTALSLSSPAAAGLLADSVTLAERLPATLDALEAGRISLGPCPDAGRGRRPGEGRGPRTGGGSGCWPAPRGRRCPSCARPPGGRCCAPMPPRPPSAWPRRCATGRCACIPVTTGWPR